MAKRSRRELFEDYASAVAYVAVESRDGCQSIGAAFHVGDGVFVTARHVVEGTKILEIATTVGRNVPDPNGTTRIPGRYGRFRSISPRSLAIKSGVLCHPDAAIDVAAIVTDGREIPVVPLGGHLDDWINDEQFMLQRVVVMGYPPVPFSAAPRLFAASAEVNTVVDPYSGPHPRFVISAMARGGFSGGPCLIDWDCALGVITESLMRDSSTPELGFMAVLSVEPIFTCLGHHGVLPELQAEDFHTGLFDPAGEESLE